MDIPRGIEVLIKKAAVDAEFKAVLLQRRAAAADEIGLVLEPAEKAMLAAMPEAQLEAVKGIGAGQAFAQGAYPDFCCPNRRNSGYFSSFSNSPPPGSNLKQAHHAMPFSLALPELVPSQV